MVEIDLNTEEGVARFQRRTRWVQRLFLFGLASGLCTMIGLAIWGTHLSIELEELKATCNVE